MAPMTSGPWVAAVLCSSIVATLTRDGLDLRYEVTGSGPALLLPAFNFRWGDYLDIGLLAGRFTVVTASPRGFGASGRLTAAVGYRVTDLASDLVAVMEAAGFERFSVFGYSFAFYRELSELPPDFLLNDLPCPLFAFWGEDDEEIARGGGVRLLAAGLDRHGLKHASFPGHDHEGMLAHINEAVPSVLAWFDGLPPRSERWVSRNGTLAKDSAHPACRRTARAHSSVEEHSPYKRRVTGSNPVAPTRSEAI